MNTNNDNKTVADRVEQSKREILSDALAGRFIDPPESFSDLHDWVDANCYGGLVDDFSTVSVEDANAVQNAVDAWIRDGGLARSYMANENEDGIPADLWHREDSQIWRSAKGDPA